MADLTDVQAIFLIGTLGSSPYLLSRVTEYASNREPPIRVIHHPNSCVYPLDIYELTNRRYAVLLGAIATHVEQLRSANLTTNPLTGLDLAADHLTELPK